MGSSSLSVEGVEGTPGKDVANEGSRAEPRRVALLRTGSIPLLYYQPPNCRKGFQENLTYGVYDFVRMDDVASQMSAIRKRLLFGQYIDLSPLEASPWSTYNKGY